MGQPGPEMVTLGRNKHLGFMFQTAKGFGVEYPISISLKCGSNRRFLFFTLPFAVNTPGSPGMKEFFFFFQFFSYIHKNFLQYLTPFVKPGRPKSSKCRVFLVK
jgi:hypothetical protein